MALPIILGVAAMAAAAGGVKTGVDGSKKIKKASDTQKNAQIRHKLNVEKFESQDYATIKDMDAIGKLELDIMASFEGFSEIMEKIHNKPDFKDITKEDVKMPEYNPDALKEASLGAGVLLGGLGGAAAGVAGGFAAAGATTAAVMALGTASTGTAIASLSGIAATNATLAALGGGAIAAGGGGMALGSTILGASTLGVGLLIGGVIFNFAGTKMSEKAENSLNEMKEAEEKVNQIVDYLQRLSHTANTYKRSLNDVKNVYEEHMQLLNRVVVERGVTDWNNFTRAEKFLTENTVLLVTLLYNMCTVKLVIASENKEELNQINDEELQESMKNASTVLEQVAVHA